MDRNSQWLGLLKTWLVLIAPFLLMAHLLNNLHAANVTFHGSDELDFHLPAILKFASQLPYPNLGDYSSATTPLFHVFFAAIGNCIGFELYKLRAVNVLISFLATAVYHQIWTTHFQLSRASALLVTLLFLLSPYFFGASFILLTDNLAWLFCMLTLYCLMTALRSQRLTPWVCTSLFLCLALLTRQTMMWLLLCAVAMVWLHCHSSAARGWRLGTLGLATLPLAALMWRWQGLVPPSFQHDHVASGLVNVRALEFTLAVTGAYFPLLRPQEMLNLCKSADRLSIATATLGLGLLWLLPMHTQASDQGFIWRLARAAPSCLGMSVLLWTLVPVGLVGVGHILRTAPRGLSSLAFLSFFLVALPSGLLYQKYFDPFIPMFIMLSRPVGKDLNKLEILVALAVMAAFVLYAILPNQAQFLG